MKTKNKKEKKSLSPGMALIVQVVSNLISLLFITLCMVYLIFVLFGDRSGELRSVQWTLLIFIPFFTINQTLTAILNTRRDFLRKRWEMPEPGAKAEPDMIINPWLRGGATALITSVITALGVILALRLFRQDSFSLLSIGLLAFLPSFALSTILIGVYLPRDQRAMVARLSRPDKERPKPYFRYLLLEHALPLMLLQAIINAGIGFRIFRREAFSDGWVSAQTIMGDAVIMSFVVIFFMWLSSQTQVRTDVHLGRVAQNPGKGPPVLVMLGVFLLLALIPAGALAGVFALFQLKSIGFVSAVIIKTIGAILAGLVGGWLGVWWGVRRESALLRQQN